MATRQLIPLKRGLVKSPGYGVAVAFAGLVGVTDVAVKLNVWLAVTLVNDWLDGAKLQWPGFPLDGTIVPVQPDGTEIE